MIQEQGFLLQLANQFITLLPNTLGGILVIVIGLVLAQIAQRGVQQLLEKITISKVFRKTPVEHFLQSIGPHTIESTLSMIAYWLLVMIVLQTGVSILGLTTLSNVFDTILGYLPRIVSALIVLLLGVGLAGFVETFIKKSLYGLDVHTSRVAGRVGSYIVFALASMIAISELGIAKDFILILFIGFVGTVSFACALAFGLGSKQLIATLLANWYDRRTLASAKQDSPTAQTAENPKNPTSSAHSTPRKNQ